MSARRPKVASLFCGCGGLDIGFEQAGCETIYAVDNDRAAITCFNANFAHKATHCDITSRKFKEDIASLRDVDIVLGGFPCQGFSKAGPKRENDERNVLYRQMKYAVRKLQPTIFVAENVDGVSQNFKGAYVKRITSEFSRIGYEVSHSVLDAIAFGLPQFRRRIIFVGIAKSVAADFNWPSPSHELISRNGDFKVSDCQPSLWDEPSAQLKRAQTIEDAIGDLLETPLGAVEDHRVTNNWPETYSSIIRAVGEGQKLCNVRHADTSIRTWDIPEAFGDTTPEQREVLELIARNRRHKKYGNIPNGNPLSIDEIERLCERRVPQSDIGELLRMGYLKRKSGGYDLKGAMFCSGIFKRPNWQGPSSTVLTNYHNPRYFIHPKRDRPFTLRECARLQGFPDDFIVAEGMPNVSLVAGYRLIGNAVPPPLARRLGKSCRQVVNDSERLTA